MSRLTVYALRCKRTGEFMPETKGGRGYSYWQPVASRRDGAAGESIAAFPRALERSLGVWRIFRTAAAAKIARTTWAKGEVHLRATSYDDYDGCRLEYRDKGRKAEQLEIVEITLVVSGVHQD